MASRLKNALRFVLVLVTLLSMGSCENDMDWIFRGIWQHGKVPLQLDVDLSPGCNPISISANESTLSINGRMTSQCQLSNVIQLRENLEAGDTDFCVHWEPLLDRLNLQVGRQNFTLCRPIRPQGSCCTDQSPNANEPEAVYGIKNGMARTDIISHKTHTAYTFTGNPVSCKILCQNVSLKSNQVSIAEPSCPDTFGIEMEDSKPRNITSPATRGKSEEPTVSVYLPPALKQSMKTKSKVVITFFRNNTVFQEGHKEVTILSEVVDITVENEIIRDLTEPIRIGFNHDARTKRYSRTCVSWDTRKDPLQVKWLADGCLTQRLDDEHTECLCNHLTYFSVLVQLEPRPVRHLLALTAITSLGCLVSVISCVALIIFLCRKSKHSKEQSLPIHLGLAVSLACLNLIFFLTGVLANAGGESLCHWVGAILHYSLLSSFTWMGIEIFHTFWLVYMVFVPSPKPYVWILIGFGLPVIPTVILAAVGDIYGLKEVVPSDDISNPYRMCWMKEDSRKALLAHYFTNMTVLVILVFSGIVMLFLVYRKIRVREEWKQNSIAFLSIWGLSCLFGTSWALTFLEFEPISDLVRFLSCFLNSFQGFFIMLRFCMLEWMRKRAGSALGSNSMGSTRQHMLQSQEKS